MNKPSIHNFSLFNIQGIESLSNGFLIMRVASQISKDFEESLLPFEINPKNAGVLLSLLKKSEISQRALGDSINIDRTTITKIIDELEKLELVSRYQNKSNRRENLLRLTDKGMRKTMEILKTLKELEERTFQNLTLEEKKELTNLLNKITI